MHPNTTEGEKKCCFHPQHIIIGVCAFCLNERLLILLAASKQQEEQIKQSNRSSSSSSFHLQLPKFSAFTSLLFSRFDSLKKNKKTQEDDDDGNGSGASTSQEDSYISIKFEGSGGVGSWEKKKTKPKVSIEQQNNYISPNFNQISVIKRDEEIVSAAVIEHTKTQLRWQKRIGHHIFQIIRWNSPTTTGKGKGKGHVPSNIDGHHVKVRHGWMRSLTKRRTKY